MNLIVLGPQGSGKGTQAERLAKKYGLEHIEMGKLLREIAKQNTSLGKKIHDIINIQAKLVDDVMIEKVVQAKLNDFPKDKGIIFDGVPRNEKQAVSFNRELEKHGRKIDLVININLPERDSVKRISKRRICKNEHVLIIGKNVQSENDKCPICGSEIFQRVDDTPERIKTRLGIYYEDTKAVIDYYRQKGILIEIDGTPSIEEVWKNIEQKLKNYF